MSPKGGSTLDLTGASIREVVDKRSGMVPAGQVVPQKLQFSDGHSCFLLCAGKAGCKIHEKEWIVNGSICLLVLVQLWIQGSIPQRN